MRDNALQQWLPQTGEVKTLIEGVDSRPYYSGDLIVFLREVTPEQEYALIIHHLPTRSEFELMRLDSERYVTPDAIIFSPPDESKSISPDRGWIAYIGKENAQVNPRLIIRELQINDSQITASPPVVVLDDRTALGELTWPATNQLSWQDDAGIWVADIENNPIEPFIAIEPSTNVFEVPWCGEEVSPCLATTSYNPLFWLANGHFLLVDEGKYEEGTYRVIESGTNRSFEIPDAYSGYVSDIVTWLNDTTIIVLRGNGMVDTWRVNPDSAAFIFQQKNFQLDASGQFNGLLRLPDNHIRFSVSAFRGPATTALYDLNLETGELVKLSLDVPQRQVELYWSPDGQHALSKETFYGNSTFLFDLNGGEPMEVSSVLGLDTCCWHWYEE